MSVIYLILINCVFKLSFAHFIRFKFSATMERRVKKSGFILCISWFFWVCRICILVRSGRWESHSISQLLFQNIFKELFTQMRGLRCKNMVYYRLRSKSLRCEGEYLCRDGQRQTIIKFSIRHFSWCST